MTISDASRQFRWLDKYRFVWNVYFVEDTMGFSWSATQKHVPGRYVAFVQTHSFDLQQHLPRAFLTDVRVDKHMENRGVGSMLVRRAVEECTRRGHKGIEGDISNVDSDHFDKLRHFYEKLGFSVIFFEPDHPEYRCYRVGKIEMAFGQS